jgi:predicted ferric reductase
MADTAASRDVRARSVADNYRSRARRRDLRLDLLRVLSYGFIALSVALFLADGGMRQFSSLGNGLTALGTVAGLVATAFLCFTLILVARVPIVDATIGQDRATTLHTKLGHNVVYGVLAHAVLLLLGYSVSGKVEPLAAFASLWDSSDDFGWACLGLVGFVAVAVSSVIAVRRYFPYEVWYAIHLVTYAAVIASLPHQFSMSGILAPGTRSRGIWIAIWLLTVFCLLAFRVFLPLYTTLEHRITVREVTPVGKDAVSIEFAGRRLHRLQARGGHWFQWRFLTPTLVLQPHPFSLSTHPSETAMRVTVRNLGNGSARLQNVRPGTKVFVEGPYGMFTDAARTRDRLVLIGAGIGIAPVRAVLEATHVKAGRAVVILRASTPGELYLADEVRALSAERGVEVIELVGNRAGANWVPSSHAGQRLDDFVPWVVDADVYACGPDPWMDAVFEDARICGVPKDQMHRESFGW